MISRGRGRETMKGGIGQWSFRGIEIREGEMLKKYVAEQERLVSGKREETPKVMDG